MCYFCFFHGAVFWKKCCAEFQDLHISVIFPFQELSGCVGCYVSQLLFQVVQIAGCLACLKFF